MKMRTSQQIARFFHQLPIFSGIRSEVIDDLAQATVAKSLDRDQILFTQMDAPDAVYIVISGCIALFLAAPDGKELVINEMRAGDFFGELSTITSKPRSTGAMAREDSELLAVSSEAFSYALHADPCLMERILETTASRLRRSSEREGALAFLDADARVARTLLDIDKKTGGEGFVRITQQTLGQYVGLTRQTVAKTLGAWRREGWVITARGGIRILDKDKLECLASDTVAED
jgi:CRP/FNR family cyclic AMP-dependent transcriptional regulator